MLRQPVQPANPPPLHLRKRKAETVAVEEDAVHRRSTSSTAARSGDAHPTATQLPHWTPKWNEEYDAMHAEVDAEECATESYRGDEHPTATELPDVTQEWHEEVDAVDAEHDAAKRATESNRGDEHPTADTSLSGPHNKWMQTLMEQVTEKLKVAQQKTTPEPLNKKRKQDMRQRTFCNTLHTLQMTYTSLLHDTFADNYSPENAATVRNLTDGVKWKLHTNAPHCETEGAQLLHQLLNQFLEEFQWKKIAEILGTATNFAHAEAKKEYEKSRCIQATIRKRVGRRGLLMNPAAMDILRQNRCSI
jgi:hypothetical protein